jgi:hypothetical protein
LVRKSRRILRQPEVVLHRVSGTWRVVVEQQGRFVVTNVVREGCSDIGAIGGIVITV